MLELIQLDYQFGFFIEKTKVVDTEKNAWISKRILELINEGKNATDAKIQSEAEYSVNDKKQTENIETK